ncbi:hypothetical protein CHU92_08160 [Flavobacterium cyanobacteriorum]|uniref:Outer membrane protein beta-barrel domain-containing protein n=1 Tax=Flavobacterium cyanobacteriorum TaxID=2022802 RepID=A0A255Z7Z6_9FLAO|nr:DUF6048 family protein [Flavobacterium cyanobacteriorum]OYQ37552.1 hypothetical protein CHU92_08160 [Flavobacterium cyanobacteriorum]
MKHIYTFIFSLLLLAAPVLRAQEKTTDTVAAPPKTDRYGLRIGADLHRIARSVYDDGYRGFEVVADFRLTKKIYIAGEIGNEENTVDDTQLNFTTKGSYLKIGIDYNAYENWLDMENMIYAGVRYGVSNFSHTLNSYRIYDPSGYFNQAPFVAGRDYDGLTAHWAEVLGGVKAEIFDNLYLGFSVRLHLLLANNKPNNFDNLYIPGFNRTYGGSFGAGFNYTVSYFIPIYKKAKSRKEKK